MQLKYGGVNVRQEENLLRNEYCQVEFRCKTAMLRGFGHNYTGWSISDALEFYTLWTQAPTYKYEDQFAERTDSELVEKIWRKIQKKFTEETTFSDITALIEKEGVKCQVYDVMIG